MENMTSETGKNIYLSGGGDEHASYLLDGVFFDCIPKGGTLLYVPVALRRSRLFSGVEDWFMNVMEAHNRRQDIKLETWNDLNGKDFSDLKRFSAIYVGGGNTWDLMKEITESGLKKFLKEYVENGGIYYGGSAGAIICGAHVDTHTDENIAHWDDVGGMDLLSGLSVACHVTQEQFVELENMTKEKHIRLLALAENAGAIVEGPSYRCVGDGLCREFGQ